MSMEPRTPISLITGSLGSGKTTLLRRILDASAERPVSRRIAVLMNEFGEIPIDSRVIRGEHVQIVELAGGCACCSLSGEFEAAVREILATVAPEMIVMEATGVAEADSLTYLVEDNLPEVRLDSVICIVDAYLSAKYPRVGYTARTQIRAADVLLINKTDLVAPEQVAEVEAQVRTYNHTAFLFRTAHCELDTDLLFGLEVGARGLPAPAHTESELMSFVYGSARSLDRWRFERLIAALPPSILRAKGFVRLDDEGYLFNYVVGRSDLEACAVERTQLVFIGESLDVVRAAVLKELGECEV